jgi:pimeloyl-ACP methyl ester carboxylesterase
MILAASTPALSGHYADVGPLRMYYEDHGQGRPLVLIHGGGSTVETTFGAILPILARSHRVIAVALLEQLHVRDADVLGFSRGGRVALELAVRHPSLVHRLIICSGFYAHAGLIPALRAAFEQPPNAAAMPKALREAYLAAAPHPDLQAFVAKTVTMMKSFPDIPDDKLRAIEAPTLVMLGDQDVILPEHAVRLAQLVKHGQLAIFPGAQHGAYMGVAESPRDPRLFDLGIKTLERFLAE